MKRFLFLICIGIAIVSAFDINAQDCEKENYYNLGNIAEAEMYSHFYAKDYNSAIESCTQRIGYYFKAERWVNYINALNDRAFLYDSADDLGGYKKAVFGNFVEADKYIENDHPEWLRAKEQINTYYYSIGDYKKSLEIIKEVIPIKEKLDISKLEISNTYLNLGTAYNRLKDRESALSSFKKSVKILNEDKKYGLSKGERYNNIARVFQAKGELDSALYYLDLSEALYDIKNLEDRFKRRKFATYISKFEIWLEKKEFNKAKDYLDLVKKLNPTNREKVIWHVRNAKYHREIGNYLESKESIRRAIEIAKEFNTRYSPPPRARRKIELVKTLILNDEKEEALTVLQEGLQILAPSFTNTGIYSNPLSENFLDKPDALIILQEKGRILFDKYNITQDNEYLESSYNTYLVACDIIKDVRQGIRSTDSKNDLSERMISVYEEAIKVAYTLSKLTGSKEYSSMAFKLAESNKALLLLENLNEQEARGFAGIPDSLHDQENDLRMYLAALEDRALREGRNGSDDDNIFQLRQELNQHSTFLEKSYPRYYHLKYNNEPVDPAYIQKHVLDNTTALIEYFVGIENIYVFVMTKDDFFMDEMEKESVKMEQIANLRHLLKERPGNDSPENEYTNFAQSSRYIYKAFVKRAIDRIPESINTLIIIPDDNINYIPFEVLLLEEPNEGASYSTESQYYLFEDYAVNYNYSATLLSKVVSKKTSNFKSNFIGYAPTFTEDSDYSSRSNMSYELSNLKCNKDEVNSIKSIIGGAKRISDNATKVNFLEEVGDYKIVHLATHAFVNQSDSKLNRIFLQDDFLSDVNLYNLELNTELAVLSACNTGSGELMKGEGVMNLARGFINAGCSSTLMSMWSVDDCTTSDLMLNFYKEIKNGAKKDEALRRAKMQYLKTASKTKLHPYYWAAFIPFGDMKPIDLKANWSFSTALPITLVIVGFFLFLLYALKRRRES